MRRTLHLELVTSMTLAGCGFKLRSSQVFAFQTVAVTPENSGGVAGELTRYLGDAIRPVTPSAGSDAPQVIVDLTQELREFQLRIKLKFRLRAPQGAEL